MTPLDLQQIYTWLLADGMIRKAEVKQLYAQSSAILKNTSGYMHPLCAVAHAKLLSAQPPHKLLTLDALCEWLARSDVSPLRAYTSAEADIDSVIDVRAVLQQSHRDLAFDALPPLPAQRSIARHLIDLYLARRSGAAEPVLPG